MSVTQAIQAVAYKALGHLRHDIQYMAKARSTRFFPQHPIQTDIRFYEDANGEADPAVVGLTRYVEALDTLAHRALVELDIVRSQLRNTEATLKMMQINQGNQTEGAPYDEVRDIHVTREVPAPEPPRKKRLCYANSQEYVRSFTSGAGSSYSARDPAPANNEEEEDPEEVIPIPDDNEQEVF